MPKGRRTSSLAQLERRLTELDSQRRRILGEIKSAVERLAFGSSAPMAGLDLQTPASEAGRRRGGPVAKRHISAEVRARLSRLARERWAKAKKAGKTRLG